MTILDVDFNTSIPIRIHGVVGFDDLPVSDLSTWQELWFTVKKSQEDADPGLLQKTKTGGGITPSGDEATLTITPSENAAMFVPGKQFYWDVKGKDPAGNTAILDKGIFRVNPVVTKSS